MHATLLFCFVLILLSCLQNCRHESETDETTSTDEDLSWGGIGKFEYALKGLPHALLHETELMIRGGHAGASCAFLAEVAHKSNLKLAARFARTFASVNTSQDHMLQWYCRQLLWSEVMALVRSESQRRVTQQEVPAVESDTDSVDRFEVETTASPGVMRKLREHHLRAVSMTPENRMDRQVRAGDF